MLVDPALAQFLSLTLTIFSTASCPTANGPGKMLMLAMIGTRSASP